MGINVSYEILMGVSGLCYRFAMKPDWCPSAPLAQNGRVWDENINALLGISLYTVADEEERKGRIIDHLNRGLPVIGMGQMGAPEWDLFTGYTEDASIFFGRSYFDSQESLPDSPYCLDENHYYTENKYRKAENYPGMEPQVFVKFFDTACEKRPVVELLKESLEICRYYYSCEPIYGCHFGNAAYEILIKGLLEDYKDNENYHVGCLADSRLCASVYLSESVSQLKDHNNREKLLKAAALYRSIYDDIVSVTPYEVLTPTFNTGTGLPWSHDVRMTLADVLKKVMDTEAEIQKLVKDILEHWTE